jgi:hypothetical protein
MNYSRPDLLPFEFAALLDRTGNPNYRIAGARPDMLLQLTQVKRLVLRIQWDVTFTDALSTTRTRSYDRTADSYNLNLQGGTTTSGYYYLSDGTPMPDPASRLLAIVYGMDPPQGVAFWKLFYDPPNAPPSDANASMACNVGFNRTAPGVLAPNLSIQANGYEGAFATLTADFTTPGAGTGLLTSNDVIIDGVNFGPLYLRSTFYPGPLVLNSGTFTVTPTIEYW